MEKDDRQVTAPACTLVGDTAGRSRTQGHGLPSWRCEIDLAKHSAVDRTTAFLAAGHWGRSPRWQRPAARCSYAARTLVDGRRPEHTHRGVNYSRDAGATFPQASQLRDGDSGRVLLRKAGRRCRVTDGEGSLRRLSVDNGMSQLPISHQPWPALGRRWTRRRLRRTCEPWLRRAGSQVPQRRPDVPSEPAGRPTRRRQH